MWRKRMLRNVCDGLPRGQPAYRLTANQESLNPTGSVNVFVETINYRKIWQIINDVWAKSFVAILLFILGLWIGGINAESRIVSDCKFANAFRADIQAFTCQRKL